MNQHTWLDVFFSCIKSLSRFSLTLLLTLPRPPKGKKTRLHQENRSGGKQFLGGRAIELSHVGLPRSGAEVGQEFELSTLGCRVGSAGGRRSWLQSSVYLNIENTASLHQAALGQSQRACL